MQVLHLDHTIGRLSAQDRRIASALAGGRPLRCVVAGIEISGLMRRRVRRVEIEIMPPERTRFTAAARRLAEGSTAVLQAATNITVTGVRVAGDHLVVRPSRAAWRGTSFIGGLLLRPSVRVVSQVGRSVGNAAGARDAPDDPKSLSRRCDNTGANSGHCRHLASALDARHWAKPAANPTAQAVMNSVGAAHFSRPDP